MTPRAYQAARRLSECPSATPAERENARQRCREYEAKHRQRSSGVTGHMHFSINGRTVYNGPVSEGMNFDDLFADRSPYGGSNGSEYYYDALCKTCGHNWALHHLAREFHGTGCNPRECSCPGFVPIKKVKHTGPRRQPVPWWTLTLYKIGTDRRVSGGTCEFRSAIRRLRKDIADHPDLEVKLGGGFYDVPTETKERIERNEVDWTWFPEREPASGKAPWRPPPEMREAMKRRREKAA